MVSIMKNVTSQVACERCGEKDPDHTTDQCQKICKCANCGENHPVYARVCEKWEKEILTLKYTKNISFLKERKIIYATKKRKKIFTQVVKTTTNDIKK